MNFRASPIVLASALILLTAHAEEPENLTPGEVSKSPKGAVIAHDLLKTPAQIKQQNEETRIASNEANSKVRSFLAENDLTTNALQDAPAVETTPEKTTEPLSAPDKPLEVTPGPKDSVISSDGGMYLDAEAGLLVYLKNVRLTSPEFDLNGANQIQVFLEKKAPNKKLPDKGPTAQNPDPTPAAVEQKDDKKQADTGIFGSVSGFGNVKKIAASGAVKITRKAEGNKPAITASAAFVDYDAKTEVTTLHGGYPWIQQGTTYFRAREPDLYLYIYKDGSFKTDGKSDTGGQLKDISAKPAKP